MLEKVLSVISYIIVTTIAKMLIVRFSISTEKCATVTV